MDMNCVACDIDPDTHAAVLVVADVAVLCDYVLRHFRYRLQRKDAAAVVVVDAAAAAAAAVRIGDADDDYSKAQHPDAAADADGADVDAYDEVRCVEEDAYGTVAVVRFLLDPSTYHLKLVVVDVEKDMEVVQLAAAAAVAIHHYQSYWHYGQPYFYHYRPH